MEKRVIKFYKRTVENNTHSNIVDDNIKEISSWRIDSRKNKNAIIVTVLTFGLIYLITYFWKQLYIRLNCLPCDPINADYFLIADTENKIHLVPASKETFLIKDEILNKYDFPQNLRTKLSSSPYIGGEFYNFREEYTILYFCLNKYIYIESLNAFKAVSFDLTKFKNKEIISKFSKGIKSIEEYNYQFRKFNKNSFELRNKNIFKIFLKNFFSWRIIYQLYSISMWIVNYYYSFAIIIITFNILLLILISYQEYSNYNKIIKFENNFKVTTQRDIGEKKVLNKTEIKSNLKNENKQVAELKTNKTIIFNLKNSEIDRSDDESKKSSVEKEKFEESKSEIQTEESNLNTENDKLMYTSDDLMFLVPGDIIKLRSGETIPCDCIILDGVCIVNESDLTGESTLVMKSALAGDIRDFTYESNMKSFLYCGTKIDKCESTNAEGQLTVLAINTGFNTVRGNQLQNLLFPQSTNFKFNKLLKQFFCITISIWILCSIVLIILHVIAKNASNTVNQLVFKIFSLLTVSLHPSLNVCLTFVSFYFHFNLNNKNVTSMKNRINTAGHVNILVLDKTGTLTQEGLELYGFQTTLINNLEKDQGKTGRELINFDSIVQDTKVYHSIHREFWRQFSCNPDTLMFKNYQNNLQNNIIFFLECLATCHSIDKFRDDSLGNSVDKVIFDSLYWTQEVNYNYNQNFSENHSDFNSEQFSDNFESKCLPGVKYDMIPKNSFKITEDSFFKKTKNSFSGNRYKLTIVKRFEFSSKYQSMCVIVKNCLDQSYRFFIKGAPEKITQLCNEKTLPLNLSEKLMEHTKNGFRVLACATKFIPDKLDFTSNFDRGDFENNLTFLGFIIFKNKLKKESKAIIKTLNNSGCKIVMSTGDNPFTSITVARECKLLDYDKDVFLFNIEKSLFDESEKIEITPLYFGRKNDGNKSLKSSRSRRTKKSENTNQSEATGRTFRKKSIKNDSNKFLNKNKTKKFNLKKLSANDLHSEFSSVSSERKLIVSSINGNDNFTQNNIQNEEVEQNNPNNKIENFKRDRRKSEVIIINKEKEIISKFLRKISKSDSHICISGNAFNYILQNSKREISKENKENKENINSNKISSKPTIDEEAKSKDLRRNFSNITASSSANIYGDLLELIYKNGKIFFRMDPHHKVELIKFYKKEESNIVAMCGDGANDCGALLKADVGISIRQKNGRNVPAHFTSNADSILIVELILKIGRGCYENKIIILKFMIIYSIIQLTTYVILDVTNNTINAPQWLFNDLFVALISLLLASKTSASYKLDKLQAEYGLFNKFFIFSIIGQGLIQVTIQIGFYYVSQAIGNGVGAPFASVKN